MSTRGVETRFVNVVRDALSNDGVVNEEAMKDLVDYAKRGYFTRGEKRALMQPGSYLSAKFSDSDLARLKLSPEAYAILKALGDESGMDVLPKLASLIPSGETNVPTPDAPEATALREAYAAALARGKDLGDYTEWSVKTGAADVKFHTDAVGKKWPALVLDTITFTDPAPKNLVADRQEAWKAIADLDGMQSFIDTMVKEEEAFLKAEGVDASNINETYGIRNERRQALVREMRDALRDTALSPEDRTNAKGLITGMSIKLVANEEYDMKVGSHTNYWPYWNNYAEPLEKMLAQEVEGSDAYKQIKNRLEDIYRRKSSTGRSINERDFEKSSGYTVVYSPEYSTQPGHQVSLKEGSTSFDPKYELLSIAKEDLPEEFKDYAGLHVIRDTDEAGTLYFANMGDGEAALVKKAGELMGQKVPEGLLEKIVAQDLDRQDLNELTLRKRESAEISRADFSMDWDSNGQINIAAISIGWWGHCHNEAPLNAMDIDPQKAVTLYRADAKLSSETATTTYTTEDAWDITGAFTSDHESGYASTRTGRATRVDDTSFVGIRNDGKHTLELELGGKTINIDGELTNLKDAEGTMVNTTKVFRENREKDDGTFEANPMYVSTSAREGDLIKVDVADHSMNLTITYYGFDSSGYPAEKKSYARLDPTKDEFVSLGGEITKRDRTTGKGGTFVEHFYNASTKEYKSVTKEFKADDNFAGTEIETAEPTAVTGLKHESETLYDSPQEIYEYFMGRAGLPKTYDTTSKKAVWNYPVKSERLDLVSEKTVEENGESFTYRTLRLQYDTMGGPSGDSSFILKFDAAGNIVDSCAIDPMPDFAYRNDHWVSAPVTTDVYGAAAYNIQGLNEGYLVREGGTSFDDVETSMWKRMATVLYASLSNETPEGHAYIFEATDGKIISFENRADFDAAVEADRKLREAANTAANPS